MPNLTVIGGNLAILRNIIWIFFVFLSHTNDAITRTGYEVHIFLIESIAMKLLFFSLLLFFQFSLSGQSQTNPVASIDERLFSVYERDYLEMLQKEHPELIERWNFFLDNAYYLTELPKEKIIDEYREIEITDLNNINILALIKKEKLTRDWNKLKVYRIKGSSKVLVFYPGKEFMKRFNNSH